MNVVFTEGEQSGLFLAGEGRDGTEGELMNGREREREKTQEEGRGADKTTKQLQRTFTSRAVPRVLLQRPATTATWPTYPRVWPIPHASTLQRNYII